MTKKAQVPHIPQEIEKKPQYFDKSKTKTPESELEQKYRAVFQENKSLSESVKLESLLRGILSQLEELNKKLDQQNDTKQ